MSYLMKNGQEPEHVLEIEHLNVAYGDHVVLKDLDLKIERGTITAAIGPSGCGKTTLLRTLNRLVELTRSCRVTGQVRLDGEDVFATDPVLLRRRVGMVFQKPNPFPMSIRENVLYGLKAQGAPKRSYGDILEQSLRRAALWDEVKDRLDRNAHTLSGGQQQRLCIARTLAVSPEVILMDEPAASLDPTSTAMLEESIIAMKGEYTVVVVTHDVPEARRVSDHTAFMYDGRILEFAATQKLLDSPDGDVTRDYLAGRLLTTAAPA
jgi:phosphate transport system ATP-binding protein